MSEDKTRRLTSEEKLDLILTRLDKIETRLDHLEVGHQTLYNEFTAFRAFAEPKLYDTKPIWEQALAEILELKQRLISVEQRLGGVEQRLDGMDHRFDVVEQRLEGVEKELRKMNHGIRELAAKDIEVLINVRDLEQRVTDLERPRQ